MENVPPGSDSAVLFVLVFESLESYSVYLSVVYILQLESALQIAQFEEGKGYHSWMVQWRTREKYT